MMTLYVHLLLVICGITPGTDAPPPQKRPRFEENCEIRMGVGKLNIASSCDNETEVDFVTFADLQDHAVPPAVPNYGSSNMADLILSRMGSFGVYNEENLSQMRICPTHLKDIGMQWHWIKNRPRILGRHRNEVPKCVMTSFITGAPNHDDARPGRHFVTKGQSHVLWDQKHVFVPLGSAVCTQHWTYLKALVPTPAKPPGQEQTTACNLRPRPRNQAAAEDIDDDAARDSDWREDDGSDGSEHEDPQHNIMRETRSMIHQIARLNGIPNVHTSAQFSELSDTSKRKRATGVSRLIDTVYKTLAPGAANELRTVVSRKQSISSTWHRKYSKPYEELLENVAEAYETAETQTERSMVLSIIAPIVSLEELQSYIPGVTEYAHTKARRYAKLRAAGLGSSGTDHQVTVRYSRAKVNSFIQFVTMPHIVVDLPFGSKKVTYSSGARTEIANVVRTMVDERIVSQYGAYLQQLEQTNLAMSRSTYLRILDACKATTRKTMRGLDYITYKGVEGIDSLVAITEKIKDRSGHGDWASNIIRGLREGKFFLKGDYKRMVRPLAAAKEASIAYALSDPSAPEFRATFNQAHTGHCIQCHALNETIHAIRDKIFQVTWQQELDKTIALYEWKVASEGISDWQKHIVRTINQELAKDDIMRNLGRHQVFLQLDWAMKFLPSQGRESMSEWYGKRGVNWHIGTAFIKDIRTNIIDQRTFVHVFDSVEQGSNAIVAILADTLARIHAERPNLEEAFLRSDNAGCYHGSNTIAAIPAIQRDTAIQIKRWDFSESQSGKGPCDRAAAVIKRHISLHVAENHKCRNAEEFLQSTASNGGGEVRNVHPRLTEASATSAEDFDSRNK